LYNKSDDEVIETLTALRGVGIWTAHWLLVRTLGRPDGFPHGDLALQKTLGDVVNGGVRMTGEEALEYSLRWSPYRTYVTTYIFGAIRSARAIPKP
jgi:DNA-3-methyladenine glycosylase II